MIASVCFRPVACPRGLLRLLLSGGVSLSLTGCVSAPPVWPMADKQGAVPAYPTVSGNTAKCEGGTAKGPVPAPGSADAQAYAEEVLFCAQTRAAKVAKDIAEEQRAIEATQNGEVLALFGLGTAAGVEGVVSRAVAPVRNLGLAAISLTGLSSALGISGQRAAFEAAASSLGCIIRTDAALTAVATSAKQTMTMGPAAASEQGMTEIPADSMAQAMTNSVVQASNARAEGQALLAHFATKKSADADMTALALHSAATAIGAAEDAATADEGLVAATATATDPTTRARNLQKAVGDVMASLSDSLFKNVNVTQIYSTAKQGYASLAGNIPSTGTTAKQAAAKAKEHPVSALQPMAADMDQKSSGPTMMLMQVTSHGGGSMKPATMSTMVGSLSAAAATAGMHADGAQQLADTVASCSGNATAPMQAQNSSGSGK